MNTVEPPTAPGHMHMHRIAIALSEEDLARLAFVQAFCRRPIASVDGGTIPGIEPSAGDILRGALYELAHTVERHTGRLPINATSDTHPHSV